MKTKDNVITKLSIAFVKNIRFTLLLFVGIIVLGWITYTQFLRKEGFPNIQNPILIINGNYQVNDKNKVDKEFSRPIERQLIELKEVNKISSTTTDNGFFMVITLNEGSSPQTVKTIIKEAISEKVRIPDGAKYEVQTPNIGKFDNKYDIIINVYKDDTDLETLQSTADKVASELAKTDEIIQAEVIKAIQKRVNPITNEEIPIQERFTKIVKFNDGRLDSYEAVSIGLLKNESLDAIKFSNAVQKSINSLKSKDEFKDYNIEITQDFAPTILQQITSLESNTVGAVIIVLLIVALLINIRSAVILASFVVIVVASSILYIYFSGNSLNIISLFALVLVLGVFVDDGTVVVEAIETYRSQGLGRIESVRKAINSIGIAKIAGSVTTILVFIPMIFISGVLGDFIRLIPITVITTLILSLLLALSLVPGLASLLLKQHKKQENQNFIDRIENLLNMTGSLVIRSGEITGKFVYGYVRKPIFLTVMLIVSLVFIILGGSFASKLKFSIFPPAEDGDELTISIQPLGLPNIDKQKQIVESVNNILEKYQAGIQRVIYRGSILSTTGSVELSPSDRRDITASELAKSIEKELKNIPDSVISVSQVSSGPPRDQFPFKIQVYSDDTETLRRATNELKENLISLQYTNRDGQKVELAEVVVRNVDTIYRENNQRIASVEAKFNTQVDTNDITTIQNKVIEQTKNKLTELGLDINKDIGRDLGSESRNRESFDSAIVGLYIALLVMYAYLVAQYSSYSLPILIFMAIPFSFPLLFPGLYLTGNPMSFFVMIGILALAGIVVNNTIIIVDTANALLKENGGNISKAIAEATASRVRPILVTSLTTIGGLLPLALSDPFWEGLAFTIVFGLLSSLIMVLVFFPGYYFIFQTVRQKVFQFVKR